MKILILGDASNPHIRKWANALYNEGIKIIIYSLRRNETSSYLDGIEIYFYDSLYEITKLTNAAWPKFQYLKVIPKINALIKKHKPDIVHAHYASSYGLLGALVNFHPFVISVWGSDVIDFPKTSILHKWIFKFNLYRADKILSTSKFMARLLQGYTAKNIEITPFGIDLSVFKPSKKSTVNESKDIIVGCIKGLEWYYGIEYLIDAFCIVLSNLPDFNLKLYIVGGGALESKIKDKVKQLKLDQKVILTGKVDYSIIQNYHNMIDIFVAISVYEESFGVSVLEASACGKPVIISDVGGMIETVRDGISGFIVPPRNVEITAEKISELIVDPHLRRKMGIAGREFVKANFDLKICIKNMMDIYKTLSKKTYFT